MGMIIINTNFAFAQKADPESKKLIELCCTWGDSLEDGVLTFSIKNGGSDLAKIVKLAINEWEKVLEGSIKFKHVKDESDADIEIKFKKGKGKKIGETVTYFDQDRLINFAKISISKKSYGITLDSQTLEYVAKHEIGHALGLGHANYKNSLMAPNVDEINTKVSACELDSVRYANQWKIMDNEKSPHPSEDSDFKCKDE
jgi:hypothetical protein